MVCHLALPAAHFFSANPKKISPAGFLMYAAPRPHSTMGVLCSYFLCCLYSGKHGPGLDSGRNLARVQGAYDDFSRDIAHQIVSRKWTTSQPRQSAIKAAAACFVSSRD